MERFSKKKLVAYLERRIEQYDKTYHFSYSSGYKQVENKPIAIIVAYGNWRAYRQILEDLVSGDL